MTTGDQFYPPAGRLHSPGVHQPATPPRISKLCASVWEEEEEDNASLADFSACSPPGPRVSRSGENHVELENPEMGHPLTSRQESRHFMSPPPGGNAGSSWTTQSKKPPMLPMKNETQSLFCRFSNSQESLPGHRSREYDVSQFQSRYLESDNRQTTHLTPNTIKSGKYSDQSYLPKHIDGIPPSPDVLRCSNFVPNANYSPTARSSPLDINNVQSHHKIGNYVNFDPHVSNQQNDLPLQCYQHQAGLSNMNVHAQDFHEDPNTCLVQGSPLQVDTCKQLTDISRRNGSCYNDVFYDRNSDVKNATVSRQTGDNIFNGYNNVLQAGLNGYVSPDSFNQSIFPSPHNRNDFMCAQKAVPKTNSSHYQHILQRQQMNTSQTMYTSRNQGNYRPSSCAMDPPSRLHSLESPMVGESRIRNAQFANHTTDLSQSPDLSLSPHGPQSNMVFNAHPMDTYINRSAGHVPMSSGENPEKTPRGAQNLPPCRVCGNKASGLHFGVNTCEACNEFFRRSLKRGAEYHCSRNVACKVWGKKRNACSYCRYRKCLEVGMSRNRIKTGRYSHKTRAEYAREIEKSKRSHNSEMELENILSMLDALKESHDRYIRNSSNIPEEDIVRRQQQFLAKFNAETKGHKPKDVHTKTSDNTQTSSLSTEASGLQDTRGTDDTAKQNAGGSNASPKACSNGTSIYDSSDREENSSVSSGYGSNEGQSCEMDDCNNTDQSKTTTNVCVNPAADTTQDASPENKTLDSSDPSEFTANHSTGLNDKITSDSHDQSPRAAAGDEKTASVASETSDSQEKSDYTDGDSGSNHMELIELDADITEQWLWCYISYAKLVPGFKHLPICDQASLVRMTWFEFWFLGAYRGFNADLKVVTYPIGHSLHETQFIQIFGEEFSCTSFHLATRMKDLNLTSEEMVLVKTLCLVSPDRCDLQDREAVDSIYWAMVTALLRILERNRPGDRKIFPKIVGKLVELRTLSEIAMRAHNEATFQQKPLLGEMVGVSKH